VLNSSSQVSRKTRARVLDAIHRLGFRPNAQARRILKRRAEMVCFFSVTAISSSVSCAHPARRRILCQRYETTRAFRGAALLAKTSPERIDLPPVLQEHGLIDGVILAGRFIQIC